MTSGLLVKQRPLDPGHVGRLSRASTSNEIAHADQDSSGLRSEAPVNDA